MSIIERINEAELEVQNIKNKANDKVTRILEESSIKNKELESMIINDGKDQIKALSIETSSKIKDMEEENKKRIEIKCMENAKKAEVNEKETIDFILRKVYSL